VQTAQHVAPAPGETPAVVAADDVGVLSRHGAAVWVYFGLIAVAFAGLFFRFFRQQIEFSTTFIDDWGHAFVIPVISGVMVWRKREELARTAAEPFWPGVLPLVLGVVCYFYFTVGISNHMLQGAAMLLCLAGLVLVVLGVGAFQLLFLPIAYLAFGVTISEQVMISITFQLQTLAAKGAWLLLKIISLPGSWFLVESSGNTLVLTHNGRDLPLNVAEACSGMRMVIAFIALAAAVAIFSCRHWWQRVAVVMLAVPVALLMNIVRVAVLGLASLADADLAAGNAHMLIGTLLLVPGLFLFLGLVGALKRLVREPSEAAR